MTKGRMTVRAVLLAVCTLQMGLHRVSADESTQTSAALAAHSRKLEAAIPSFTANCELEPAQAVPRPNLGVLVVEESGRTARARHCPFGTFVQIAECVSNAGQG